MLALATVGVKHMLDLSGAKLDILNDRLVRVKRTKNTIVAKVDDAVIMNCHGFHEDKGVGFVLGSVRHVLSMDVSILQWEVL